MFGECIFRRKMQHTSPLLLFATSIDIHTYSYCSGQLFGAEILQGDVWFKSQTRRPWLSWFHLVQTLSFVWHNFCQTLSHALYLIWLDTRPSRPDRQTPYFAANNINNNSHCTTRREAASTTNIPSPGSNEPSCSLTCPLHSRWHITTTRHIPMDRHLPPS